MITMASYLYMLLVTVNGVKMIKIGRTTQEEYGSIGRLKDYPIDTKIIFIAEVPSAQVKILESQLITAFCARYNLSHGREYFLGNICNMRADIGRFVANIYEGNLLNNPEMDIAEQVTETQHETIPRPDALMPMPMPVLVSTTANADSTVKEDSDFVCPRCGYSSSRKSNIRKHLYKVNICPAKLDDIDLTDEVREYVITNKRYYNRSKPVLDTTTVDTLNKLVLNLNTLMSMNTPL